MALIDNEKLYENIEKKLELIKAAKEQPVIMKPFIKDFAYRFCWSSNALEGNTLSLDETICLIDYDEVRSGHTYTEYQEAKNLYKAIKKEMLPLQKREITEAYDRNKDTSSIVHIIGKAQEEAISRITQLDISLKKSLDINKGEQFEW